MTQRPEHDNHNTDPRYGENGASRMPPERQPVFNLPGIIVFSIGVLVAIHIVRVYFLDRDADFVLISALAFIPASYGPLADQMPFPLSVWWSPFTYSLLHGDVTHLLINLLWLAAFGSPIARRIGAIRFLLLTAVCSAAGALFHYISHPDELVVMVGASGAVSGYMGAAGRFAFNTAGGGRGLRSDGPTLSLVESLSDRNFLIFSLVWLVMNYVIGSGIVPFLASGAGIAWEAHVGGFLAGILLFSFFEPTQRTRDA